MPGFFETLGAQMAMGRSITEEDTATTRKASGHQRGVRKKILQGPNPIGQHFGQAKIRYAGTYEIVGVVKGHPLHDL